VFRNRRAERYTPTEIRDKLNKEINAGLADPKIQEQLAGLGGVAIPMTPAEFGELIADEAEKWGKVVRPANVKPEWPDGRRLDILYLSLGESLERP
jgi:tripartite-type tricarboxylate transporter receptor subunit TctC